MNVLLKWKAEHFEHTQMSSDKRNSYTIFLHLFKAKINVGFPPELSHGGRRGDNRLCESEQTFPVRSAHYEYVHSRFVAKCLRNLHFFTTDIFPMSFKWRESRTLFPSIHLSIPPSIRLSIRTLKHVFNVSPNGSFARLVFPLKTTSFLPKWWSLSWEVAIKLLRGVFSMSLEMT